MGGEAWVQMSFANGEAENTHTSASRTRGVVKLDHAAINNSSVFGQYLGSLAADTMKWWIGFPHA